MKVNRINHLGVVPKNIEQAKTFFGECLGLMNEGHDEVQEQKVRVEFYKSENSRIELLQATDSSSPVAKFLEQKGSGIQHIAFDVDDVVKWIEFLKSKNIEMIDSIPRKGAHNTLIAFVHPKSTGGVLVELVQEKK